MAEETQTELEKPAKVYQLNAITKSVKDLKESSENCFKELSKKMDTLVNQTSGLVTQSQLQLLEEKMNNKFKIATQDYENKIKTIDDKLDIEVKGAHKDSNKVFWAVVFAAIAFVGDALSRIFHLQ